MMSKLLTFSIVGKYCIPINPSLQTVSRIGDPICCICCWNFIIQDLHELKIPSRINLLYGTSKLYLWRICAYLIDLDTILNLHKEWNPKYGNKKLSQTGFEEINSETP